jgi:hypothetical protein
MARIYKSKFRIESDEVQGEGSWVEFQRPTWGMITNLPTDDDRAINILTATITAWNWTDDNGDPIPLPVDVETLPQQEANWLMDNCGLVKQKEALKNSSSQSSPT